MLNFTFYSIHFTWFGSVWQTIYQIIDFGSANRFLDELKSYHYQKSRATDRLVKPKSKSGCLDKTLYFCTVFWFNRHQVIHQKFLMKFK